MSTPFPSPGTASGSRLPSMVVGTTFLITLFLALTSAAPSKKTTLTAAERARMFWQEFSWSPGGRHMLLTGMLDGGKAGLYIARANGTEARALTDTSKWCGWGAWSPDGRHIAYASRITPAGNQDAQAIFVMNADGSGARQITPLGDGAGGTNGVTIANASTPSWSPDGSRIAFVSTGGGIWTIDPDGASPTELCEVAGAVHNPVWSLDGQRIVFYYTNGEADSIGIVNADGSSFRSLGAGVWPNWSPHSDQLAFTYGVVRRQQPDVWIMKPDGSGRTRLAGPGFFARWSPNGRDVVFLRAEGEGWPRPSYLYSIRLDGKRERRWPAR